MARITGTNGRDSLVGSGGRDAIFGLNGIDTVRAGGGDDRVVGGAGVDLIDGDDGDDFLVAGSGSPLRQRDDDGGDTVRGGEGDDTLVAGLGDSALGEEGRDTVFLDFRDAEGDVGGNIQSGIFTGDTLVLHVETGRIELGAFNDQLFLFSAGPWLVNAHDGEDRIFGSHTGDTLIGGGDADAFEGFGGDDVLVGSRLDRDGGFSRYTRQHNTLEGGEGDDLIYASATDAVVGGDGRDHVVLDLAEGRRGVSADFSAIATEGALFSDGETFLHSVESAEIRLGSRADAITGAHRLTLTISGGAGADLLRGGSADDVLRGDDGADSLHGGKGDDVLSGGGGGDEVRGGRAADQLLGGEGDDLLEGGAGADALDGGAGADRLLFRADTFDGSAEAVTGFETGQDVLDVSKAGVDFVFVDTFSGQAGEATLDYDGGSDTTTARFDLDGDAAADLTLVIGGMASEDDFLT